MLALLERLDDDGWAEPTVCPGWSVSRWFDLARDFTERWVHQQQIRDAVGEPGLDGEEWIGPVVRTFVWSLPRAYQEVAAAEGTVVALRVDGPGGGEWSLRRIDGEWSLDEVAAREHPRHR